MKTIYLKRCSYGERNIILAYFAYDKWIYEQFFKNSLGTWSPVLKGFILKDDPNTPKKVHKIFAGSAFVDASALYETTISVRKEKPPVLPALSKSKQQEISNFIRTIKRCNYNNARIEICRL